MARETPVVTFTTDYGTRDHFVAVCKGVLLKQVPSLTIVDVTHEVPPGDVARGAALLEEVVAYFPATIHLAAVDPGVGSDRRAIALRAGKSLLVGPDNGLLIPAAEALGGVAAAVEIAAPAPASATFHGRDVFAPAAAALAAGEKLSSLGPRVPPRRLVRLDVPEVRVTPGALYARVRLVDRFGNCQLTARRGDLVAAGLTVSDTGRPVPTVVSARSGTWPVAHARTFSDQPDGTLCLMVDSSSRLQIAVTGASAADRLDLREGADVVVSDLNQE